MKELKKWLDEKSIKYKVKGKEVEIEGFGRLLFIEDKNGKIIDTEDYNFILSDEEYDALEGDEELNHMVFKWGTRFYYSPMVDKPDKYGETVYEPVFNDLINIGKYHSEFEDFKFVHLGVHTGYELLNGSGEADKWVSKAKFYNHDVIGICEKNTLAGTLPLQLACKKGGLRCVLGETVSVAVNYEPEKEIQDTFDLKIFVENYKGWRNLLNISKFINVDYAGFIPEEELLKRTEGLIVVFATDSYLNEIISDKSKALKYIKKYQKAFGKDNLFYQIDCSEYDDDEFDYKTLNNTKNYISKFSKILQPLLISDSYYVEKGDSNVKDFLNKIDKRALPFSYEQHYKDLDEIFDKLLPYFDKNPNKFDVILKSAKNTRKIADRCIYQIDTGNHKLPRFEVKNPEKLYDKEIFKGFKKKVIEKFDGDEEKIAEYLERVDNENEVIKGAGFIDYFLILWDIVRWAKKQGILVGPARGSAGGSLVAYLLGITEIDPIEYNLLFERFLNKARVSGERAKSADALPDIDVDFEGKERQRVKKYIEEKYGHDYVCSIGTYTRLKPKSALKDFSRVKGVQFNDVNFATKEMPDSHHPEWSDLFKVASEKKIVKKFVQSHLDVCEVIKAPLGQPKAGSIHPSAVLIVPKKDGDGNPMKIQDWMPIKMMDGMLVSEWEGKYIDAAGFLKEDILGIAQLDKFKYVLNLIKEIQNKKVNLNKIPINRKSVMNYFKRGWNEDVFQFGTSGLKNYSKKVKPDGIEDLISMNALFRPGPMDSNAHEDFVQIKHGKKEPEFDEFMEEVTENTFGLYVYQEQIMQAMVVGGLTLAEADQVRTYMKKFDDKSLAKFKVKFVKGYSKLFKTKDKKYAEKVWDKLYAFSGYGFNRSHSAAYSLMGYWCQYLKVKYPLEFWTASLNFADEKNDMPQRLAEIEKIGSKINVKPPSVNKSSFKFTADGESNSIYWSLTKIKGVGDIAASMILESRGDGQFFDLGDFISKVPKSKVNKRVVQSLIMAGAFDEIGGENGLEISELKERYQILKKHAEISNVDLPKDLDEKKVNTNWYWSIRQRELTGFGYVDFKPLIKKRAKNLKKFPYIAATDFEKENLQDGYSWTPEKTGKPFTIAGRIAQDIRPRQSKNGNWIVRFIVENNNAFVFVGIFGDIYDDLREQLDELAKTKELFCVNGYGLDTRKYGKKRDKTDTRNNEIWLNKESKLIKLTNG